MTRKSTTAGLVKSIGALQLFEQLLAEVARILNTHAVPHDLAEKALFIMRVKLLRQLEPDLSREQQAARLGVSIRKVQLADNGLEQQLANREALAKCLDLELAAKLVSLCMVEPQTIQQLGASLVDHTVEIAALMMPFVQAGYLEIVPGTNPPAYRAATNNVDFRASTATERMQRAHRSLDVVNGLRELQYKDIMLSRDGLAHVLAMLEPRAGWRSTSERLMIELDAKTTKRLRRDDTNFGAIFGLCPRGGQELEPLKQINLCILSFAHTMSYGVYPHSIHADAKAQHEFQKSIWPLIIEEVRTLAKQGEEFGGDAIPYRLLVGYGAFNSKVSVSSM